MIYPIDPVLAPVRRGDLVPNFLIQDINDDFFPFSTFFGRMIVIEWVDPLCKECLEIISSGLSADMIAQAKVLYPDIVFMLVQTPKKSVSTAALQGDLLQMDEVDTVFTLLEGGLHDATIVMDFSGEMKAMFDAKIVPHLFIIDRKGILIYSGGFDDKGTYTAPKRNLVLNTLLQLRRGKAAHPAVTKTVGCEMEQIHKYGQPTHRKNKHMSKPKSIQSITENYGGNREPIQYNFTGTCCDPVTPVKCQPFEACQRYGPCPAGMGLGNIVSCACMNEPPSCTGGIDPVQWTEITRSKVPLY